MVPTDRHRSAAKELLTIPGDIPPEIHRALLTPQRIERTAQRLAMLELVTKTTIKTERTMVGDTDRWLIISKTSPSGKALFVCRSCGTVSPGPSKTCPAPVKLWDGTMRECKDWEPSGSDKVG